MSPSQHSWAGWSCDKQTCDRLTSHTDVLTALACHWVLSDKSRQHFLGRMGEGIVRQLHFFYFYFLSVQLWLSSLQKSVLYIVTGWPYSLDGGNMNDCFHSAIHCLEWMILVNSPLPLMANVLLLPSSALLVWFLEFSLVQVSGSTDLMLLGLPFFF